MGTNRGTSAAFEAQPGQESRPRPENRCGLQKLSDLEAGAEQESLLGLDGWRDPGNETDRKTWPREGNQREQRYLRDQATRWEERYTLNRGESLDAELPDIPEVEYRGVQLGKVVLVGIFQTDRDKAEYSLRELTTLTQTAGAKVLAGITQRRESPDAATFLGTDKAKELRALVASLEADMVIVDDELAPSQRRGLEDVVKVKVIDRATVILDISVQHATSREGKAEVELAQLEHLLPRLRGWGESMSRQTGGRAAGGEGIGSRGPGEIKIELNRRHVRTRMSRLRRLLREITPTRETKRAARRAGGIPAVAIVGCMNAGKSSLLNRLAGADVLIRDALFVTLDPSVRKTHTATGRVYILADTVGFVRRLPTQLVEAFRSTLEETAMADLLLHVVDAANSDPMGEIEAVNATLDTIESIRHTPVVTVINKVDAASTLTLALLRRLLPEAVEVSARSGQGIERLQEVIASRLPWPQQRIRVLVWWESAGLLKRIHHEGSLVSQETRVDGTFVDAWVEPALAVRLLNQALGITLDKPVADEAKCSTPGMAPHEPPVNTKRIT